jgi:hypothetical protein
MKEVFGFSQLNIFFLGENEEVVSPQVLCYPLSHFKVSEVHFRRSLLEMLNKSRGETTLSYFT